MSCSPDKERLFHSMHYSLPMWPHIGHQSLSPTITLLDLPPYGLAGRACRFHPQGVTAVVDGYSFMHWTAIWAKSEQLILPPPVRR